MSLTTGISLEEVEAAVDKALDFLSSQQLENGEFATYIAKDVEYKEEFRFDSTPFATAFILHSLGFCDDDRAVKMARRAVPFLLGEMLDGGVWAYWTSHNERLIPPDLDDTACISHVLKNLGVSFPENREAFLRSRTPEGLFYTWVKGGLPRQKNEEKRTAWQLSTTFDVCCVVNANIVLYLGEGDATSKAVEFVNQVARENSDVQHNQYYLDTLAFPYAVSRAFLAGVKGFASSRAPLLSRVVKSEKADGSFGNALSTSLGVCTLLNFAVPPKYAAKAVQRLLQMQQEDGGWPIVPFYVGPNCGSRELTTGLCVEALAHFCRQVEEEAG